MKKALLLAVCVLLLLPSCGGKPPREPDERDISPDSVAYILSSPGQGSPLAAIEDRELIGEFTGSLNGLRSELGVFDENSRYPEPDSFGVAGGVPYEGSVTFYGEEGQVLAYVAYYDGGVYRDHYWYQDQGTLLFDRTKLARISETAREGVSRVTGLYFECIWGADKVWVEDTETGAQSVVTDREGMEEIYGRLALLRLRVDEPCGEEEPWRFHVRWTYLDTDELLEEVKIGADGRIQRDGHWCTPLNLPVDMDWLEQLAGE